MISYIDSKGANLEYAICKSNIIIAIAKHKFRVFAIDLSAIAKFANGKIFMDGIGVFPRPELGEF